MSFLLCILAAGLLLSSCKKDNKSGSKDKIDNPANTQLKGEITNDLTLDASKTYTLAGSVYVNDGATLTIPAGTTIKAQEGFDKFILVLRGGKININGTADKPVTMAPDGDQSAQGYWGGLIINGKAGLSTNGEGSTEISATHKYGGSDDADNSGSITYLKLIGCGARSSANVEHNGLTLNGVGSGTKIENVFILNSSDDGVEFFGGAVHVKNLLVVDPDDDMFDFTQGYRGELSNCYGVWTKDYKSSESDPRGVEADGNLDGLEANATRQSDFTITNMTIDLRTPAAAKDAAGNFTGPNYMHDGLKIRRGAHVVIKNALIKGAGESSVANILGLIDGKGDAADGCDFTMAWQGIAFKNEIKATDPAKHTLTKDPKVTGCAQGIFSWTGYSF